MQKIAIIPVNEAGHSIVRILKPLLNATVIARGCVATQWGEHDAFVFIGAMGICVRTIAPLIGDARPCTQTRRRPQGR